MIVDRRPETKSAIIPNSAGQPTLHTFERAESGIVGGERAVLLMYRCSQTGELRQWGLEYTSEELLRLGVR